MYGIRYGDENNSIFLDVFLKLWFVAQIEDTEAILIVVQYKFAQMMRQKMSIYTMMYCYSLIDRQSSLMSTARIVPKLIMAKVATPKYRLLKIMIDWEYISLLFVCCFRLCLSFSFCSISESLHGFLRRWSCNTDTLQYK